MGYIKDFLGGAAEGGVVAAKQALLDQSNFERDEAQFRRQKSLDKLRADRDDRRAEADRAHRTSEREAGEVFQAGEASKQRTHEASQDKIDKEFKAREKELDRDSAEYIAELRLESDHAMESEEGWQEFYREARLEIEKNEDDQPPEVVKSRLENLDRLMRDRGPAKPAGPKPGAREFEDKEAFVAEALRLNKGKGTDAQIRAAAEADWDKRMGGGKGGDTGKSDKPEPKAAKPVPVEQPKPAPKPAAKSIEQQLIDAEAHLKADDDLKKGGSGGIGRRAVKAGYAPLGLIGRRRLEQKIEQLRKQVNAKKTIAGSN